MESGDAEMTKLTQPLKWHGGKHDLAKWIISLMPPRCQNPNAPAPDDLGWLHYVEPYFGGGSVLLANEPEGISEVVCDKNKGLAHFWSVLRDEQLFPRFQRYIEAQQFSEEEWQRARRICEMAAFHSASDEGAIRLAAEFFVACRQSLAGRMDAFAAITKNRTRRGMNEQVSAWLSAVEGLPAVHARLKRVLILNGDALDVIRKEDGPRTLFYLDPPYSHETRATTKEYGEFEMTQQDHAALLNVLVTCKGKVMLSGYRSELYDRMLVYGNGGWRRHEKKINNHAAGGKTKRVVTECVWTNY